MFVGTQGQLANHLSFPRKQLGRRTGLLFLHAVRRFNLPHALRSPRRPSPVDYADKILSCKI
jgi:hypothetical protein